MVECAAFQPHAPSHLDVREYSHTTPIFDTLLSHSSGCYCLGAGYIGVIRAYYQKDHLWLENCVLLLPSFTSGGPAAVPF